MKASRERAGFSLLEIVAALAIATMGALGALGLIGTALELAQRSRDDLVAASFASMVFGALRVADPAEIPPAGDWRVPGFDGRVLDLRSGRYEMPFRVAGDGHDSGRLLVRFRFEARMDGGLHEMELRVFPRSDGGGEPRTFRFERFEPGRRGP